MAKVLTSRKLTSLKVAAGEGPFEWVLLQMSDRLCACIPVLKRSGGVMLALPELVFSTEELEDGSVGSELPDVGPWLIEAIPVQGTVDDQTVNVLFLDFPLALFGLLRTFQRKAVWPPDTAFFYGTDTAVIPDEEELVLTAQAWVADGKPRAVEGYHTALEEFPSTPRGAAPNAGTQQTLDAVLHQLTNLTSTVSQLQSDMGEMRAGQKPSLTADQPPATRQSALARVTALAGPAPKTRTSPVVEVEDAADASGETVPDMAPGGEDLDTMLKVALLQFIKPTKKKKKPPSSKQFLGLEEGSSDSEQEEDPLKRLYGAKGTMLQEKLRLSMDQVPAQYVTAVETNAARTMGLGVPAHDTLDRYCREELPVGSSKMLGYLTTVIVKAASMLRAKEVDKAHLILVLALAAIEQAQLDGHWDTAWRLTHLPQPPFSEWKVREAHLPTLKANAAHSRLLHPTWVAATVARLKDEEVLTKRRGKPQAAANPWQKGKGRGKQNHEEQAKET